MAFRVIGLLLAGLLARCQGCSHSAIPSETIEYDGQVELILDCSSNYPTVTAIFYILPVFLQGYTILYTCTHDELVEPIQGSAILNSIINRTESLNQSVLCNSLCTFGGCYFYGSLGNIVPLRIAPLYSCHVCHEEGSGTCNKNLSCMEQVHDRQCVPTQDLSSGLVNCNCCTTELTSHVPVATNEKCACNCTAFHEGYDCSCQNDIDIHCSNISMCNLNYCDVEGMLCEGPEHYRCLCDGKGVQNCTEYTETHASISIIVTSIFAVAVIIISCTTVFLILISFASKNTNKKGRDTMDLQISNENCTIDPVDIVIPKHIVCGSRSASFSTLCHPFHSALSLNSHNTSQISLDEKSSPYANSVSHSSDTEEGYVKCVECTSNSSNETCSVHHEVHNKANNTTRSL